MIIAIKQCYLSKRLGCAELCLCECSALGDVGLFRRRGKAGVDVYVRRHRLNRCCKIGTLVSLSLLIINYLKKL